MSVGSNIWKLYVIKASKWMTLFMPIIWLFYEENGLTITDLFLIQAIYSVTIATLEIPSGYVADVFGRKNSMVTGTFFGFLGILIYSLSFGFGGFLLAALCLGVGQSFISGSDTALMYDSLVEINRSNEFIKLEGRTISMGNFAEAIAFVIGGSLAEISLRTPFYYQVVIAFTGFTIALFLIEPKGDRLQDGKRKPWRNIKKIIHYAMIENNILRAYIFYSAIFGAATLTMAWLVQPYFKMLGLQLIFFGLIGAGLNLAVAFSAFYAHLIERKISTKTFLSILLLLLVTCYFTLAYINSLWSLFVLLLFYLTRGVATPVLRHHINRQIPSNMRATIMSIRSFIIRILFASTSPIFGYVADLYSLQYALYLSGSLFLFFGLIVLIYLLKQTEI
jgi:MFS family permease|tara:strand:- start:1340 stop:2515 length:1176 start_codon:yes stop_codon:yes gene_type:complete